MTQRARLALALAALAAVSVVAVAVVSYVATADRLRSDVDDELVSYASRLRDPDGRVASMLCDSLQGGGPLQGGNRSLSSAASSAACRAAPCSASTRPAP